MPLEIRPVSSRRDLSRFIRLPWRIYRNHQLWVPPLVYERKRFLDRSKNPFFTHGEAEYFLAWRDGDVVGRISAQVDRDFNDFHGNAWGMFGFFECSVGVANVRRFEQLLAEKPKYVTRASAGAGFAELVAHLLR